MHCSQKNTISSEITSDAPLSAGTLAYLEARARNSFYDFIMTKFKDAERGGLSRAQLARRINKRPDQISHMLGAPGNWTLGTITALLVGICREELLPASESFLGRPSRNFQPEDFVNDGQWARQELSTGTSTVVMTSHIKWKSP